MNPERVDRDRLIELTDLPNIGPKIAAALVRLGIDRPSQLVDRDPLALYRKLCTTTGARQDPCVLDVFISVTRFMQGDGPMPWWAYTDERKRRYPGI